MKAVFESGAEEPLRHMHLPDAFLRESARLNPLDACTYASVSTLLIAERPTQIL
jgi:hypothetical protein